jgi:hypothetical protein
MGHHGMSRALCTRRNDGSFGSAKTPEIARPENPFALTLDTWKAANPMMST